MENFSQKEMLITLMGKMDSLSERVVKNSAVLESIEEQARKTNGRVLKLEDQYDALDREQGKLGVKVGAIATIAAVAVTEFIRRMI